MLWFDGKGVANFRKEVQELLKIPKVLMEGLDGFKLLFEFFVIIFF